MTILHQSYDVKFDIYVSKRSCLIVNKVMLHDGVCILCGFFGPRSIAVPPWWPYLPRCTCSGDGD